MPAFNDDVVAEVLSSRPGLTRVLLGSGVRAYALTESIGPVAAGDAVVVNTTAVELGLGTGGWHVVHWNLSRGAWREPGPGHLMKLRYTSLQADTGAVEETHPDLPARLDHTPVVVGGLHSQLPVVVATIVAHRPGTRVAYVMTDGGALPIAMSDVVAALRDRGALVGTVTAGHAFGGDLEALNVPSALTAARHLLDAEVVVVAMGPGVAGTASRLGYTALEVAPALDAVAWLGGRPIACLRCSSGDGRERHRGVSHHSLTALDAVRSEVDVPLPPGLDRSLVPAHRHRWPIVDPGPVAQHLAALDLRVTTMGRGIDEDPLFFAAAAAAGAFAAGAVDPASRPAGRP